MDPDIDAPAAPEPSADQIRARLQSRSGTLFVVGIVSFVLGFVTGPVLFFIARGMSRKAAAAGLNNIPEIGRLKILGIVLTVVAPVLWVPSLLEGSTVTLYVDSTIPQPVTVEVDGKAVGRVLPNALEQYRVGRGKRSITLRDSTGAVVDGISVSLESSGPYIFNPGAARQYELKTITYSKYGLGGDNWTRTFGPGRWHEIRERVDYEFERPPESISGYGGEKKIWLTRKL